MVKLSQFFVSGTGGLGSAERGSHLTWSWNCTKQTASRLLIEEEETSLILRQYKLDETNCGHGFSTEISTNMSNIEYKASQLIDK